MVETQEGGRHGILAWQSLLFVRLIALLHALHRSSIYKQLGNRNLLEKFAQGPTFVVQE